MVIDFESILGPLKKKKKKKPRNISRYIVAHIVKERGWHKKGVIRDEYREQSFLLVFKYMQSSETTSL
jgi:hypothetical protein